MKDLGDLKYFFGLELARSSNGIYISQRYYGLQLIEDVGLLGAKPQIVSTDHIIKLRHSNDDLLDDLFLHLRLIGRLIYLTISRTDIVYAVNKLSQYVSKSCRTHLAVVHHLLRYLKSADGQGILLPTSCLC